MKGASCMQIKVIDPSNYDETYFYSCMGKFFAERKYKKEMPYLVNEPTNTWFIAFDKGKVVGFVAINELKNKITLQHDYVEESHREKGVWTALNVKRLSYLKGKDKTLEIALREQFLIDYWKGKGFEPFRTSGSYTYMRKEAKDEKD